MPKSLLEQPAEIVANGCKQAERVLEMLGGQPARVAADAGGAAARQRQRCPSAGIHNNRRLHQRNTICQPIFKAWGMINF